VLFVACATGCGCVVTVADIRLAWLVLKWRGVLAASDIDGVDGVAFGDLAQRVVAASAAYWRIVDIVAAAAWRKCVMS